MRENRLLDAFQVWSLSISSHALADFSEFPDSRTFYAASEKLKLPAYVHSLLYMATCNRVEVYAEFSDELPPSKRESVLAAFLPVFSDFFEKGPETYSGAAVLEHLIAVASGLKSLALGETQIAGQLKRDIAHAQTLNWVSSSLMTLVKKAIETQKKIRSQTGISENAYSLMSLVSNTIDTRSLQPLSSHIVLVGASEMSAKVARFAHRRGVRVFTLVRKDLSKPMNADLMAMITQGDAEFDQITLDAFKSDGLRLKADALICASSTVHPLVDAADIERLHEREQLAENAAIIDLSLPANTAPDIAARFSNRLISMNSLQKLSDAARADRAASACQAEPIIQRAVYQLWLDLLYRKNPTLVQAYLEQKTSQSEVEWQRSADEALLSAKQRRIMYDFLKKEQRRALASHREMILDLITGTSGRLVG
jgi:glutamyl-tRNA reductase